MVMRSSRLPRNHSAGCLEDTPLRTVHQRPPKKIAPSTPPASHASTSVEASFIVVVLPFLPHRPVFLGDPVPRVEAAKQEAGHQQRQDRKSTRLNSSHLGISY